MSIDNISRTGEYKSFAGLDLLRAAAILMVFFFHYPDVACPEWMLYIKDFGWTGVDLFFVLSGFLIARTLFTEMQLAKTISLKSFFIKRSLRILPAYFFVLAVYFLIPVFRERGSLPALWRFLTFTHNIQLDSGVTGTFSHAWSLCIEEQFYLIFPLILSALLYFNGRLKGIYIFIFFLLFTVLIRVFIWHRHIEPMIENDVDFDHFWFVNVYYSTYTRLDGLLTGIGIAAIYVFYPNLKNRLSKYGNWFTLAGLLLLYVAYKITLGRTSYNATIYGFPLVAFSYGLLVFAAASPQAVLYRTRSKIISNIAILSYSVYLCHKGIIHLCRKFLVSDFMPLESPLMFWVSLILTFIAAVFIRLAIEKPFLGLRRKLLE